MELNGKNAVTEVYGLSPMQSGMIFHALYDQASKAYIWQYVFNIGPSLDLNRMERSWNMLLANHSILRSGFYYDDLEVPVQCVFSSSHIPIKRIEFISNEERSANDAAKDFILNDQGNGFDLKKPPLMRLSCLVIDGVPAKLVWSYHHLVIDGWSLSTLFKEILMNYDSPIVKLQPKEDRYSDFVKFLNTRNVIKEEAFWKSRLSSFVEPCLLAFIKDNELRTKGIGEVKRSPLTLDEDFTERFVSYGKEIGVTANTILQCIWSYVLFRYTSNTNVVFGVTMSGRPAELDRSNERIGLYINTLPFATLVDENIEITEWLRHIQLRSAEEREFQYCGLNEIQQNLSIKGDWFDTLLVFENYPLDLSNDELAKRHGISEAENAVHGHSNYPLVVVVMMQDLLSIQFEYNTALIDYRQLEFIREDFKSLLLQVVEGKAKSVEQLKISCDLKSRGGKDVVYNQNGETLLDLFEKNVLQNPSSLAFSGIYGDHRYREVSIKVNELARRLIDNHICQGDLVGILLDSCPEFVISMLACFKVGAAYVPLDSQLPSGRLKYLIEDSCTRIVITRQPFVNLLEGNTQSLIVDQVIDDLDSVKRKFVKPSGGDLAYVMYTSGSTGRPKGAMIEHDAILNVSLALADLYHITSSDRVLQFSSMSFDMSLEEIFPTLIQGASIVFKGPSVMTYREMVEFIKVNHVTVFSLTPQLLHGLIESGEHIPSCLRMITLGGEKVIDTDIHFLSKTYPSLEIFNAYGPTETTVLVTTYTVPASPPEHITIGSEIQNLRLYLLDKNGKIAPTGVAGEICIAGVGTGRGYVNNPELTDDRFFEFEFNGGRERCYRSGDKAVITFDGNFDYIGRFDHQVKLRGFRIELGEMENTITRSGLIKQCVVLVNSTGSNASLVAYVVPKPAYRKHDLLNFLSSFLPYYMLPSSIIELEEFPTNANGKIDRAKLSLPATDELDVLPITWNTYQQTVREIWSELLSINENNLHLQSDFFSIGGNSLLAIRCLSRLRKKLGIELTIRDIFANATINDLSSLICLKCQGARSAGIIIQSSSNIVLSFSQERLWFIDKFSASLSYNLVDAFYIKGDIDLDALSGAFQAVVNRHDTLRTVFYEVDGKPYGKLLPENTWKLEVDAGVKSIDEIQAEVLEQQTRPFNLESDHLIRAHVSKEESRGYVLIITTHHIATDWLSKSLFISELTELYSSLVKHRKPDVPVLSARYSDFASWQRKYFSEARLTEALSYWASKLANVEPLRLSDNSRENSISPEKGASYVFTINNDVVTRLRQRLEKMGVTLFMSLVAVYKSLLYRYTGQNDICIGVPYSERFRSEFDNLIGLFVNPLVLRDHIHDSMTFRELVTSVKTTTLDAFTNNIPFERIVQRVQEHRHTSNPIFQVQYALKDSVADVNTLEGLEIEPMPLAAPFIPFDMIFEATVTQEGLRTNVQYRSELFEQDEIELLSQHFCDILESVLNNPDISIGAIQLGRKAQADKLQQLNNRFTGLIDLFKTTAKTHASLPAVVTDRSMCYQDLDILSDKLSQYLKQTYSIRHHDVVAIIVERDEWAIVTILAIMKAGAAFLPIDIDHPVEHQIEIIADSTPALVIVSPGNKHRYNAPVLVLSPSFRDVDLTSGSSVAIEAKDAAYIIYTSGSTGKPKGVVVTHGGIVNTIQQQMEIFEMSKKERALQFASLSFDASVSEILISLLCGASLYIAPSKIRKNPDQLVDFINSAKVTIATIPPVLLRQMDVTRFPSLTKLISAGEAAPAKKIREYLSTGCCFNAYGPTEVSICATVFRLDEADTIRGENIPIGFPMKNVEVYILDDQLREVPEGIVGELYIGGFGVAAGYLNRPELTASRFMEDPFKSGGRIYKTGDLAKRRLDGSILFVGRNDTQVKIRGNRVELEEIEHLFHKILPAHTSVVSTQTDPYGEKQLVGYVKSGVPIDLIDLNEKVAAKLPSYMVPAVILQMTDLPITISGKLDRNQLPNPFKESAYVPEINTDDESSFLNIVADVLGISYKHVKWEKSFFNLGGHSIGAIQLVARLREMFHDEVALIDVFETNSLRDLWKKVNSPIRRSIDKQNNNHSNTFPLTGFQRRIWIQSQFDEIDTFSIPMMYQLSGKLDLEALNKAYETLIGAHDALRTSIVQVEGQTMQRVMPVAKINASIKVIDLSHYDQHKQLEEIEKIACFEFDLAVPPLVKLEIYRLSDEMFVLVCLAHHIVTDHWSIQLFNSELIRLYSEWRMQGVTQLDRPGFQFKDFVSWQQEKQSEANGSLSKEFWNSLFSNSQKLDLPLDFPQPLYLNRDADLLEIVIESRLLKAVNEFAKRHSISVYMVLLGTLYLLLRHLTKKENAHIATPLINRGDNRFENIIGCLLNMLVIEIGMKTDQSTGEFFQSVKSAVLNSIRYQWDFYDQLEAYQSSSGRSLSPLYEIGFNYMIDRRSRQPFGQEGIVVSSLSEVKKTTNTPVWVSALHTDDLVQLEFRYSTQLFKRSSVERWGATFKRILSLLVASAETNVAEISDRLVDEQIRDKQDKLTGLHQNKIESLKKRR